MNSSGVYKIKSATPVINCSTNLNQWETFLGDGAEIDREERLKTHVKRGRYFSNLAIVLELIRKDKNINRDVLKKIVADLEYLQEHYAIVPKKDD